jgi:hypothetical protein
VDARRARRRARLRAQRKDGRIDSTMRLVLGGSSRVQVQAQHALRRSSPMLRSSTWIGGFSCSMRMRTRLLLDRLMLLLPSRFACLIPLYS